LYLCTVHATCKTFKNRQPLKCNAFESDYLYTLEKSRTKNGAILKLLNNINIIQCFLLAFSGMMLVVHPTVKLVSRVYKSTTKPNNQKPSGATITSQNIW
jgi:hypothetical protein